MELKVANPQGTAYPYIVSIAPLWNWKTRRGCWEWQEYRFNRTFMELKARRGTMHMPAGQFQSHLYGIERASLTITWTPCPVSIAPLWNWKQPRSTASYMGNGFNRTFMELKDCSECTRTRTQAFQSHLYGIESIKGHTSNGKHGVSIAPLWNWKRKSTLGLIVKRLFQSHLYGIESENAASGQRTEIVSIAPLWNWKCVPRPLCARPLCFNRTFMELKVSVIRYAVTLPHRFNRTFMELKDTPIDIRRVQQEFQSHLYGIESLMKLS